MIANDLLSVDFVDEGGCLWRIRLRDGATVDLAPPVLEIDGELVTLTGRAAPVGEAVALPHGPVEQTFVAEVVGRPGLSLRAVFRIAAGSPVVRFRYEVQSDRPRRLTKTAGAETLAYLGVRLPEGAQVTEVQLSQFNEQAHSFCPVDRTVTDGEFENAFGLMGPILTAESDGHCRLLAYEHGSQVPDAFLHFVLSPERRVTLAVKGNTLNGQIVGPGTPFKTISMQAALVAGSRDEMAAAYREFVLRFLSPNAESRKPYIFYNTWAFQERNHAWNGKPYLESMTQARMLAEINVAHRMGIDVFVLDTGWYEKTGDWRVDLSRFSDGLAAVKAKLDGYGMKLGLWFNPTVAAVSSDMHARHRDCLMTRDGVPAAPQPVWETEASQWFCLVSRYADAFAQELIRLNREVGVTYFKWDAIGQYGCNDSGHDHGTAENSPQERREIYAFQLGGAMARVVDTLCAACPEAIVDFDITEGDRTVGLQFLSAGKYFLINNGPYSMNYNMPVPTDGNVNLFFYPGPARAWICRMPLTYDRWIPSVLFLTHYLPDNVYTAYGGNGPREVRGDANQWISLASLVLGQNGIWGDLLSITEEGVARFGRALGVYKTLRDDITAASLIRTGTIGGSPEVYEKVSARGRGAVSLFASAAGTYRYVTRAKVAPGVWHDEGVVARLDAAGRGVVEATFTEPGAKLVFFGVDAASGL